MSETERMRQRERGGTERENERENEGENERKGMVGRRQRDRGTERAKTL